MAPAIARRPAKTVCVMDAFSPLGVALVDRLIQRGYAVHAAAFFPRGEAVRATASWGQSKRVSFFRADPLDYHSIAAAIRGCSGLFYSFDNDAPYDELMVELELRAAQNVLEACAQSDGMDRVVFTSSVTAVIWNEDHKFARDVDERDWSDPNFCRRFKLWHGLSKAESEKTAWALAMDRGVDMVAVNAGLVLGGGDLSPSNPYLKGAPEMYDRGVLVTAKLSFLVDAHICVFESPNAYGRYLCFNRAVCRPDRALALASLLSPDLPPPPSDGLRATPERIHCAKLNKLMLDFAEAAEPEQVGRGAL